MFSDAYAPLHGCPNAHDDDREQAAEYRERVSTDTREIPGEVVPAVMPGVCRGHDRQERESGEGREKTGNDVFHHVPSEAKSGPRNQGPGFRIPELPGYGRRDDAGRSSHWVKRSRRSS